MSRPYSSATSAYFASRTGTDAHGLVWVEARNRDTGQIEAAGFWTGDDVRVFVIDGVARTYYGAGAAIDIDPIKRAAGLQVRTQRIRFAGVTPEVRTYMRVYDLRHGTIEIHRALFHPLTGNLVDEPHRLFAGYVDKIRWPTPIKGGTASVEVEAASAARALATPLTRKRSDASLRARAPGDAFRQYASIDDVSTKWGSG